MKHGYRNRRKKNEHNNQRSPVPFCRLVLSSSNRYVGVIDLVSFVTKVPTTHCSSVKYFFRQNVTIYEVPPLSSYYSRPKLRKEGTVNVTQIRVN